MTNLKFVGAAVIAACAVSSPALAQAVISNPGACSAQFASANCQNMGAGSPYDPRTNGMHRRTAYHNPAYADPAVAAAGVAGAAVGTGFAIATAPFNGWNNSYAEYGGGMYGQPAMYSHGPNGWYGDWDTYASRNGIVCRPGTLTKGADGQQHLCQ